MRKIILHIVNSNVYSGLENVACDIIKNTEDEYDGIYVTKSGPIIEILKEKRIKYEIVDKLSKKEIRRVTKKYNPYLIHAHDYTASCMCAMSNLKVPIISHLHNNSPWIKTLHPYSFLYLICSNKFKKIFTVSESIEKEYIFSKYIKNKILCVGNPVSTKKILESLEQKSNQKKYDICCIGRLTEQKNPLGFLEIIFTIKKAKQDIKVVWVGDGELKDLVVNKRDSLNLKMNIDFVGFQKNPYSFLSQSKVFLLASKWEGYGLVAFEALTLGIPCVVSNVGGLPTIVDDGCGKLCKRQDDYTNEIKKLLFNKEYYSAKSKNAYIKSEELDNTETYYNNLKLVYKSITKID